VSQVTVEELEPRHLTEYRSICAVNGVDGHSRVLWYPPGAKTLPDKHVRILVPSFEEEHLAPIQAKILELEIDLLSER